MKKTHAGLLALLGIRKVIVMQTLKIMCHAFASVHVVWVV